MPTTQQHNFEKLVKTIEKWSTGTFSTSAVQFMLSFFVSQMVTRWWEQIKCVAWPDRFLLLVNSYIPVGG